MLNGLLTSLARSVAIPYYARRFERFEKTLYGARDAQQRWLLERVALCRETRFGRAHHFSEIRTMADFRQRVPIADYDDMAPYINAVARGELEALFPPSERLLRFTITTGTTGVPKLNPVTATWLRDYCRAWDMWSVKLVLDHPEIVGKKVFQVVGTWEMGHTPSGLPISMVSALAARHASYIARRFYALPHLVSAIPDPTAKYYTMLRLTVAESIGLLVAINPGSLLRLAEVGHAHRERLVRDIHDGTLRADFDIPAPIRRQLDSRIRRPAPEQARRLERLIEQSGTFYPKDYWPQTVIGCWLGGTVGYQSRYLAERYGHPRLRDLGLVSSEGRHTLPFDDDCPAGVLAATSNFYEFIPLADRDQNQPTAWEACELQEGQDYSLVMTTAAGYYRYRIGDIVRCRGFVGDTPLIEFIQKESRCGDLEGEKLTEHQFLQAASDAAHTLGIGLNYVTAVPRRAGRELPHYVILVEKSTVGDAAGARRFGELIDEQLCAVNFLYRARRREQVLSPPQIWVLPDGSWTAYIAGEIARRGTGEVQYKHPGLVPDSMFLEQFTPVEIVTAQARAAA
ncbi:MAG: GH3 auxin-responsive promoter family protein [Planctomycetales bacterium]